MSSTVRYHQRRLADVAAALRLARTRTGREQRSRAQLADHQQQRLDTVVRHAAIHPPFYRRRLADTGALGDGPVQLQRLPVLDKSLLMEHFDELVCDPRLRRDQLLDWVGQLTSDQLYLDRYRVMLTSGSSGRPGLFVYDPVGWRSICTQILRISSWAGLRPNLPRQRLALSVRAHAGPDQCHPRPQRRRPLTPGPRRGRVAVHPLQFALLVRDPRVGEFQVVQHGPVLRILIVPSHAATAGDDSLETQLGQAVTHQLLKLGVPDPQVTVERREQLRRSAGGKLKLVIADSASTPVHTNAH